MSLHTNTYKFLLLINLFAALNLIGKTNQTSTSTKTTAKSVSQSKPQHSHKKKSQCNQVLEVKSETELQEILSNNAMVVIEFYGPDCGACTMFKKKYDALAKKHTNIVFVKINGDTLSHLGKKYNITAHPSFVFMFNNSNPIKTVVGGHKDSIEKAIQELIKIANTPAPAKSITNNQATISALIKELTTLAELEALIQSTDKLVVVDYHAERWCGPCQFFGPLFNELANEHSDVAVFVKINTDKDQDHVIAKKHGVKNFPTTFIFKDKKTDQAFTTISGANKAGVKQAILQAAPAKTNTPATPAPAASNAPVTNGK